MFNVCNAKFIIQLMNLQTKSVKDRADFMYFINFKKESFHNNLYKQLQTCLNFRTICWYVCINLPRKKI